MLTAGLDELLPGDAFSYRRYMGAERTVRETWRRHIVGLLDQALERNDAAISEVADAIATTMLAGRHVYAFGAGHSLALVSEMHRRAGSMKVVRPLWNAELTSRIAAEAAGMLESRVATRPHQHNEATPPTDVLVSHSTLVIGVSEHVGIK